MGVILAICTIMMQNLTPNPSPMERGEKRSNAPLSIGEVSGVRFCGFYNSKYEILK
jgi:hypothetical protein